jgi:hypothetical protein
MHLDVTAETAPVLSEERARRATAAGLRHAGCEAHETDAVAGSVPLPVPAPLNHT